MDRPEESKLTVEQLLDGVGRVQQALTLRQQWLLSVRRTRAACTVSGSGERAEGSLQQIPSEALKPESWAALQKARAAPVRAMAHLSARERLLIRLQFEGDFTLEEIATVFGLDNAQTADRRIREAVERLREGMSRGGGRLRKSGRKPPQSAPPVGPQ